MKEELWDSGELKREGRSVREGIEASICSPEPCQVSSSLGCGLVVGSVGIPHIVWFGHDPSAWQRRWERVVESEMARKRRERE